MNWILLLPGHLPAGLCRRRGSTKVRGKGQGFVDMSTEGNASGKNCAVNQQEPNMEAKVWEERTVTADISGVTAGKRSAPSVQPGVTFTYTSVHLPHCRSHRHTAPLTRTKLMMNWLCEGLLAMQMWFILMWRGENETERPGACGPVRKCCSCTALVLFGEQD